MLEVSKNNNDPFGILKTTKFVLDNAKFVQLRPHCVEKIILLIDKKLKNGLDENEYGLGLTGNYEKDVQLLLIEDSVNFCFWSEKGEEKWQVEWPEGNVVPGGWYSLIAVFKRALAEQVPILDPYYFSELTIKEARKLFRSASSSEIPLIDKRLEILVETGKVLINKYDGKFLNLVEEANFDTIEIVKLIYNNFPSFQDVAEYGKKKVFFLKRAQILANDLSFVTKNSKRVQIKNLDKLTAFADYKIPQILRHFGVITYNEVLSEKVNNYKLIKVSSPEEIEIRSATIQGVNLIKNNLKKYTANQIDNAIWLISQDQSNIDKPYHRTYTIFY